MALILSIDTSLEQAAVGLHDGSGLLAKRSNSRQADHASWIHTAILGLMNDAGRKLQELEAVAVASGPGSYTGLRVAMATAKGFCYALGVPLITETTLRLTAARTLIEADLRGYSLPVLIGPMIDARRMEVFTALYDGSLNECAPPAAIVLEEMSFSKELRDHLIIFSGNGSTKWKTVCTHSNALFQPTIHQIEDLASAASDKFSRGDFADLAYTEPDYFKNAYLGK